MEVALTVAVAIRANDGVVLASDSMGTDRSIASQLIKVRICDGLPLAWAYAGSVYLGQAVQRSLAEQLLRDGVHLVETMPPYEVADTIAGIVRPAVRAALESLAVDTKPDAHEIEVLFVGRSAMGPVVIVIHGDQSVVVEDESPLVVIGGARQFASAVRQSMAHYLDRTPDLRHALPLAWRTVDAVCQVSSFGVGAPVQLALVDAAGARILTPQEIGSVEEQVQAWLASERATLYDSPGKTSEQGVPRLALQSAEDAG